MIGFFPDTKFSKLVPDGEFSQMIFDLHFSSCTFSSISQVSLLL